MEDPAIDETSAFDDAIEFVPERYQLARVHPTRSIPRVLIVMPLLVCALLTVLWLRAEPGATLSNGTISLSASTPVSSESDLFQLPAWQDEQAPAKKPALETADLR